MGKLLLLVGLVMACSGPNAPDGEPEPGELVFTIARPAEPMPGSIVILRTEVHLDTAPEATFDGVGVELEALDRTAFGFVIPLETEPGSHRLSATGFMPLDIAVTRPEISDPVVHLEAVFASIGTANALDTDPKYAPYTARVAAAVEDARAWLITATEDDRARLALLTAANPDLFALDPIASADEADELARHHGVRMIDSFLSARTAIRFAVFVGVVVFAPEAAVVLALVVAAGKVARAYQNASDDLWTRAFSFGGSGNFAATGPKFVDGEPQVLPLTGSFRSISDAERSHSDPVFAELAEIMPLTPPLMTEINTFVEPALPELDPVSSEMTERAFHDGELVFSTSPGFIVTVTSNPTDPIAIKVQPLACPAAGEPQSIPFVLTIAPVLPAEPPPDPLVLDSVVTCFHPFSRQRHVESIDATILTSPNALGQILRSFESNHPTCFTAPTSTTYNLQADFEEESTRLRVFDQAASIFDATTTPPSSSWTGSISLDVPIIDDVSTLAFSGISLDDLTDTGMVTGSVPASFVFDVVEPRELACLLATDPVTTTALFDTNQDGTVSLDEYRSHPTTQALHSPDQPNAFSFAIGLTLLPATF